MIRDGKRNWWGQNWRQADIWIWWHASIVRSGVAFTWYRPIMARLPALSWSRFYITVGKVNCGNAYGYYHTAYAYANVDFIHQLIIYSSEIIRKSKKKKNIWLSGIFPSVPPNLINLQFFFFISSLNITSFSSIFLFFFHFHLLHD